ncbi:hypothetical protein C8F04DRAFT_948942 [Mycena alexandri]|uniref:Uncharacterized protein n=1 Tax=Mycena alexandri TaxID=1745969 RepID=A0AAD6XC87_9AGAR|nr:hypothetical protein C8F04DRAFT_948942 [Mycena alexandri]
MDTPIAGVAEPRQIPRKSANLGTNASALVAGVVPVGIIWDPRDHSCGYDATFTILANLWAEQPDVWEDRFVEFGDLMSSWTNQLKLVAGRVISLESTRNTVRRGMYALTPEHFPYGPNQTSIDRIARAILPEKDYASGRQSCGTCGFTDPSEYGLFDVFMCATANSRNPTLLGTKVSQWIKNHMSYSRGNCPACRQAGRIVRMQMTVSFTDIPSLLVVSLDDPRLVIDPMLHFDKEGVLNCLKLRGVIYGGHGHFTSRYVSHNGAIWYHDGITTGRQCRLEGNITHVNDMSVLSSCGDNRALAVLYALA